MIKLHWIVRKKLRSNRGASIAMALLLFVVCSVIGSVVLTAGTASAGRLSGLEKTDQRYYSVASAAELVAKELDGKSVIYEKSVAADGSPPVITVDGESFRYSDDTDDVPLLTALAVHYARDASDVEQMELVFADEAGTEHANTKVYIVSELDDDGALSIELSDEGGFRMTLTMLPAIVRLGERTDTDEFEVTTKTEVNKISWSVSDIK